MVAHADSATALGMPPDQVETLTTGGYGDSDTHKQVECAPRRIQKDDIFQHPNGGFRTVAQVLHYHTRETVLYFRAPHAGPRFRLLFAADAEGVTVYRPKGPGE